MRIHGLDGRDGSGTEDWLTPEEFARSASRWRAGDRPSIEHSIAEADPSRVAGVLAVLIEAEVHRRRMVGDRPRLSTTARPGDRGASMG